MSQKAKVYVVIYTVYHHVYKLGIEVQKGLEASGVAAKMFQGKYTKISDTVTKERIKCRKRFLKAYCKRLEHLLNLNYQLSDLNN